MGNHVWDYNDLAQKDISIVGTDSGQDFAIASVIGHEENPAKYLLVEIHRGPLPQEVQLYVDLLDPMLQRCLRKFYQTEKSELLSPMSKNKIDRQQWSTGWHEGREVVFLKPQPSVQVPVLGGEGRISPLVVGGIVKRGAKTGTYEVVMIQRQPEGEISGSASLMLQVGKVVSKAQTRHG
jgi:hypothetical protein